MSVKRRDRISGQLTTGHDWDGIEELETPIPKPFVWAFLIAFLVAAIMWLALPSWPLFSSEKWPYITSYWKGLTGYSDAKRVERRLAELAAQQKNFDDKINKADLTQLVKDPNARKLLMPAGAVLYREHCAMCHGSDATGQPGFPSLVDDQWLWDGDVEGVYTTIKFGINTSHDETQSAEMPGFLKDETLTKKQVEDVVEYVRSISGLKHSPEAAKRGAVVFEEDGGCSGCHGEGGVGGVGGGAPNLTDKHWIYGGDRDNLYRSIAVGRKGVMPHWVGLLREAEIRQLALYVKWLAMPAPKPAPAAATGPAAAGKAETAAAAGQ